MIRPVSLPVDVAALQDRVRDLGPLAYVVTVSDGGNAHVVSANVGFAGDALVAAVGPTTAANAERTSRVTLLWPAPAGADYCLIVDGEARVDRSGDDQRLSVSPVRAVLHRLSGAPTDLPSCVTVLDRRA
jgi:hypothetical protein